MTQRDTFLQHKTKSRLAANDSLKSMDWSKVSLFTNTKLCLDWRAIIFKRSFRSLVTYVTNRPGWIDPKRPVCDKTFLRYQFFSYRIWYFFFNTKFVQYRIRYFLLSNFHGTKYFQYRILYFLYRFFSKLNPILFWIPIFLILNPTLF